MTLISHKFIDVLRELPDAELPLVLSYCEGRGDHEGMLRRAARSLADDIEAAEKFDFGDLRLERVCAHPDLGPEYRIPNLTDAEREAWLEGLIPLPAPTCWFEFVIDGERSGVLVRADWSCTRLDWAGSASMRRYGLYAGGVMFNGHRVAWRRDTVMNPSPDAELTLPSFVGDAMPGHIMDAMKSIPAMITYLALMLVSRTTEVTRVDPPPRLNAARVRRGRTPLAAHRVVRIVPEVYLRVRRAEAGLARLPPRLHWRRSHVRTLHRGEGGERRILIPRFLVGRAEDGEVSHEYRYVEEK